MNSKWCTNVTIKESLCCEDIELLSLALRPLYLPREINQVFVTVVYIHPKANVQYANEKISALVHRLSSASPDSPSFVLGDFSRCRLTSTLPHFKQYVTCQTHGPSTRYLCYGNIPSAYLSRQLPALGNSDHSMVQLVPLYRQKLKRVQHSIRTVKTWTSEGIETLNGCFEITDWDVFLSDGIPLGRTMSLWYVGHSPKLFTLVSKNTTGENHAVMVCRAFIKTVHSGRLGYHWRESCRYGV